MFCFADSADALYHADYMDVQMDELCLEKAYSIGKFWKNIFLIFQRIFDRQVSKTQGVDKYLKNTNIFISKNLICGWALPVLEREFKIMFYGVDLKNKWPQPPPSALKCPCSEKNIFLFLFGICMKWILHLVPSKNHHA